MNLLNELQNNVKPVATKNIFGGDGKATLIKINKNATLAKHQSRTNALLVLLSGKATYEEENRKVELVQANDFVHIPEKVLHSVFGNEDAQLLLIH